MGYRQTQTCTDRPGIHTDTHTDTDHTEYTDTDHETTQDLTESTGIHTDTQKDTQEYTERYTEYTILYRKLHNTSHQSSKLSIVKIYTILYYTVLSSNKLIIFKQHTPKQTQLASSHLFSLQSSIIN
ncbi:MAG: hypothetical protein QOK61_09385, partial [Nitrososphaeraceae archaeon]|nr:hypothetical protein [Nitrososphaeraceae archaeon]